jgi:hypothetical protein
VGAVRDGAVGRVREPLLGAGVGVGAGRRGRDEGAVGAGLGVGARSRDGKPELGLVSRLSRPGGMRGAGEASRPLDGAGTGVLGR